MTNVCSSWLIVSCNVSFSELWSFEHKDCGFGELSVLHNLRLRSGPDGYPRVLDYSIFKSLLVPYSKNFTTRLSSRVVTISYFLSNHSNTQKMVMWNFCNLLVISYLTKCYDYNNVHLPVFYCQFNLKLKTMSMKSNNLAFKLPQQLHVSLDDNQLLPLFRVKGDFEHLCQYM